MTNRRTFITQTALAAAGIMVMPELLKAKGKSSPGLQLYTLRDILPKDVKGVTEKVAKAGYKEVETFGYGKEHGFWGTTAKDYKKIMEDNGLTSPSGHYGIDQYFGTGKTDDLDFYISVAKDLGQEYLIVPALNHDFIKTADDCKKVAEKLNSAAVICGKSGLKLGYHNHNFEWKPVDGTTFYDVLLANTDPKLVHMEMDIYWVVRAGQDPLEILEKHKGRFRFAHVKDADKANKELTTEVGKGSIDFKTIVPAARKAGVTHFIVEQENFENNIDPITSVTESCTYLRETLHV